MNPICSGRKAGNLSSWSFPTLRNGGCLCGLDTECLVFPKAQKLVIPALGKPMQEHQEFKVNLSHLESSRSVCLCLPSAS